MSNLWTTVVSIVVGGAVGVWISRRLKNDTRRDLLLNLIAGFQAEIGRVRDEMGDAASLADLALRGTRTTPRLHPQLHAAVAQTGEVDREALPWLLELDRHLEDLGVAKAQWDTESLGSRTEALARMNAAWALAKERLDQVDHALKEAEVRLERAV
jgi:hypothetical protein